MFQNGFKWRYFRYFEGSLSCAKKNIFQRTNRPAPASIPKMKKAQFALEARYSGKGENYAR